MEPTFVVYGTHACQWCTAARNYLTQKGYAFEMKYVDDNAQYLTEFKTLFPEVKTVPQITMTMPGSGFTEKLGGYDQMVAALMHVTQGM